MNRNDVKKIISYYCGIPGMVRLLKVEQAELESRYNPLKGTDTNGMPGGGGPGNPTEAAVVRLDDQLVWERLWEIRAKLLTLERDAAVVRGCLDGLNGKYKQVVLMRYMREYSWPKISVRMGVPDSTVRHWHDRAVLRMGEGLAETDGAEELLARASRARTL